MLQKLGRVTARFRCEGPHPTLAAISIKGVVVVISGVSGVSDDFHQEVGVVDRFQPADTEAAARPTFESKTRQKCRFTLKSKARRNDVEGIHLLSTF